MLGLLLAIKCALSARWGGDVPAWLHSPRVGDSNSCFHAPGEKACQAGRLLLSLDPQGIY